MRSKTMYLGLVLIAFMSGFHFPGSTTTSCGQAYAQTTGSLPLVQKSNLVYQGAFRLPQGPFQGATYGFDYARMGFTYNPVRKSLFINNHTYEQKTAEITIPQLVNSTNINNLNRATIVQNLADALEGKLNSVNPSDSNAKSIGAMLVYNNQLYISGLSTYDGAGTQTKSQFVRPLDLSVKGQVQGPFTVGSMYPGWVFCAAALIPQEWHAILGGPALSGGSCASIAGIQPWGPTASVFNPSDVGVKNPVPASVIVGYSETHPTLGTWQGTAGVANPPYNQGTFINGMVFPGGTRSLLFLGRTGLGPSCYGGGTSDPSPGSGLCYDPDFSYQGSHAYPYAYYVWAYDANDLVAVKNGQNNYWDIVPYATWSLNLPFGNGSQGIQGAAYDPTTRRIYISQACADTTCSPVIHAYQVNNATPTPTPNPSADTTPPSPPTGLSIVAQ